MHKFKCIILMSLIISHILFASTSVAFSSRDDFNSGSESGLDPDGEFGRMSILNEMGVACDRFDSLNKSIWVTSGNVVMSLSGTARAKLSATTNSAFYRTSVFSPADDISVDCTLEIFQAIRSGGIYFLSENGSKVGVSIKWATNPEISFPGSPDIAIPSGKVNVRLVKHGTQIHGYYFDLASRSWVLASTADLSGTSFGIGLGLAGNLSPSYSLDFAISNLRITPYLPSGSWTSAVTDLSSTPTTTGTIAWDQDLPVGTRIVIQTSTSQNGSAWTSWSAPYDDAFGSVITSPPGRYIRVAATLYSDELHENSPVLDAIRIRYPDADPSIPILSPLSHPAGGWASPTALSFSWAMPAGNPAPEAIYTYALKLNGNLTATASAAISEPVGQVHPLTLPLPAEGSYSLDLKVQADASSGGRTVSAQTYSFGYDATPPGQVDISSPTHPPLLFANNRNPVFRLSAVDTLSGVSGYAAVLDKAPTGDPGSVVNAGRELRYGPIDNGTWYLHARAIDLAGNAGPISHYGIRVDFNGELLSPDYVKALPNPVRSDQALLEYELAAPATELSLEFLNTQGELLLKTDGPSAVGKNYYTWNVAGLANGVYLFRVRARSAEDGKSYSVVRKVAVIR